MKLLLDEMLGRTANWLRIFGIDTVCEAGRKDRELLEKAKGEKLTLVTRDEALCRSAAKAGVRCVLVKSNLLEEQLTQILAELDLKTTFPLKIRCPACSGELEIVEKEKVKAAVPESVYEAHEKFWKCVKCGKAYWEGGHWKNITRIFGKVKEKLKEKR